MAKGKAKFSSEAEAAPQTRSLRSRKRECPSDELPLTGDGEGPFHQQERNNTAGVSTHIQSLESSLQECVAITNQLPQAAEQSCLIKHDASTEEKQTEKTMKDSEELEENSAICPSNDCELQGCIINLENDGKKEMNPQEVTGLLSNTCTDHHQVLTYEDGGSCAGALEKQLGVKKKSYCNLESRHDSSQEEPSHMSVDDLKEVSKESALGLPARKKRRMGMCGLTEKERSHFLQTQNREIGHNGVEKVEKQLCSNIVDRVAQEDITTPAPLLSSPLSIPVDSATVQGKAEIKLQSSHCEGDTRAETEVTTLDGDRALWRSGCCQGKTSEAAEKDKEMTMHSVSLKQQEEAVGEVAVKRGDGDEDFVASTTETFQNEETEKNKDGSETDTLLPCVTETRDELMDDNEVEAGVASSCAELCEPAETPSDSEKKDNCAPVELGAGSSSVNTEHNETRNTTESFGSQYFDYVSDSQLNSIALTGEKRMEKEEDADFPCCPKDATNLICGLIRELSSLNRKVMATHRELENLRRGSKTSRSSTR